MKKIFLLALTLAGLFASCASYDNTATLSPNGLTLMWDISPGMITGELHAVNANWLMFGIQSQQVNSSDNTDWIVAWLNQTTGIGHFSDRYSSSSGIMKKDNTTDWTPLDARFEMDHFIFKFQRPLKLCDPKGQNIDIDLGQMTARYAFGSDYTVLGGTADISLDNNNQVSVASVNLTLVPQSASSMMPQGCPEPAVVPPFDSQPTAYYTSYLELIPYVYRIYWNFTQTSITGEVHVKTTGWVGFGLSPDGGMRNADVFVGWITNDGHVNFTDRYIDNAYVVRVDQHQDWQMLHSREQNGYTVFKFTRLIKTCDSQDREIEIGSPHIIFAYGNADPASGRDISYHGFSNRGTLQAVLISSQVNDEQILPVNVQQLKFTFSNVIIPSVETFYYNELFKVPNLPAKMHIIKHEIVLPTINLANYHHYIYYECGSYNGTPAIAPGDSTTNSIYDETCQAPSSGWAVGGALSSTMPNNTGFPIGPNTGYTYIRSEIHYNNPNLDFAYIDYVTLVLYVTSELRQYDAGLIALGSGVDGISISIPPGETAFNKTSICYNKCLRSVLNQTDIQIIRAFPHTHLTGTRVSTRLIRNGVDIGAVYENPYYNFNFQQTYALYPYITIKKDDALVTTCTYNTMSRTNFTYGGFGTKQEMCIQYVTYYPKIDNFYSCLSIPDISELYSFVLSLNRTGSVQVEPLANQNMIYNYINQALYSVNQTSSATREAFEQFNMNHSSYAICGMAFDGTSRSSNVVTSYYSPPDSCSQSSTTTASTTTRPPIISNIISMILNALQSLWSYFFN